MSLAKKLHLFAFDTTSNILFIVILCAFQLSRNAIADNSSEINVTEENGIYYIEINKKLNIPENHIRDVLSDIIHIYRLNPSIIESEILTSKNNNETWLRTKVLCCVPTFCREVERVDAIKVLPSGEIQSNIIPEHSDFLSGISAWKITSIKNNSTYIYYQATIEPDFYIPSLLGVKIIKNQFTTILDRIEKIATINAKREQNPGHSTNKLIVQKNTR